MKKSPFIDGFKQPTLSQNSFFVISDVRGDGEGKLVIWSEEQSQIIVYKGSNREIQKPAKIKNVNAIIQYYDQQESTQPAIALAAQNALYIFRGLMQSFRLRVPDVIAEEQQQIIWSQYAQNPSKLSTELMNIKVSALSQKAKYYLSASSDQRKKQIIQKVFQQGISQKDSISAVAVIKQNDTSGVGNVVIGTQLNRLYVLDTYGHKIIHSRIIQFAPCLLFGHGNFNNKYAIICVSRQGTISIYLNNDKNQPSQSIRLNTRITSADLSYPDFAISTADKVMSVFSFSNNNMKMSVPKYSLKFNQQPIKIAFMKKKGYKLMIVAFQNQFRLLRDKDTIYRYFTDFKLNSFLFGSFARQETCLILLYQNNGFEVLIGHRLFNPKQNYQNRLPNQKLQKKQQKILQIPKKTSQFMKYWQSEPESLNNFKIYQRSMKLLKWQTLKGKVQQKATPSTSKVELNPKILGLGPEFIVKLQIQNISNNPIFNVNIVITHQNNLIQISKQPQTICMLAPFTPILKQIQLKSVSMKPQRFRVDLNWKDSICSTIVCLPGCAEMEG